MNNQNQLSNFKEKKRALKLFEFLKQFMIAIVLIIDKFWFN